MKILYDHQCFVRQNYGGISRYHYHLIKEFESQNDVDVTLSLTHSNNQYINNDKKFNVKNFLSHQNFKGKVTLLGLINRKSTISLLKKGDYDVFHPTYYDPYFLKYLFNKPFVLNIHDMIHEVYPEIDKGTNITLEQKKELLKAADLIIVPSKNTQNDLIRSYNVSSDKIEVIYLAASINKEMAHPKEKMNLPDKYILFVGKRDFYKNFINFFLAIEPLLIDHPDIFLITAGGGKFTKDESKLFESKNLSNKVINKPADDLSLATLYSNALAFVFPTLYEGFGIPALEAMNCDCPVIMSNTSSLPEVGGDAAVYFNPTDLADILAKTEMVIFNNEIRNKIINSIPDQRKKFSFTKTALQTRAVYERVINK